MRISGKRIDFATFARGSTTIFRARNFRFHDLRLIVSQTPVISFSGSQNCEKTGEDEATGRDFEQVEGTADFLLLV